MASWYMTPADGSSEAEVEHIGARCEASVCATLNFGVKSDTRPV